VISKGIKSRNPEVNEIIDCEREALESSDGKLESSSDARDGTMTAEE